MKKSWNEEDFNQRPGCPPAASWYSGEIPFLSAFEHNRLPGFLFPLCRNSVFGAGIGSSRQSSDPVLKPAIEPLIWFPFPHYMTNARPSTGIPA
ncbi:MAG: hypothetical protein NTV10_00200 [Methanoregula sp.]|nr:hypothetical protein [Methanoregula sp.]